MELRRVLSPFHGCLATVLWPRPLIENAAKKAFNFMADYRQVRSPRVNRNVWLQVHLMLEVVEKLLVLSRFSRFFFKN